MISRELLHQYRRRRIKRNRAFGLLLLLPALVAIALFLLAGWYLAALIVGAITVVLMSLGVKKDELFFQPSLHVCAQELDEQLGLKERLTSLTDSDEADPRTAYLASTTHRLLEGAKPAVLPPVSQRLKVSWILSVLMCCASIVVWYTSLPKTSGAPSQALLADAQKELEQILQKENLPQELQQAIEQVVQELAEAQAGDQAGLAASIQKAQQTLHDTATVGSATQQEPLAVTPTATPTPTASPTPEAKEQQQDSQQEQNKQEESQESKQGDKSDKQDKKDQNQGSGAGSKQQEEGKQESKQQQESKQDQQSQAQQQQGSQQQQQAMKQAQSALDKASQAQQKAAQEQQSQSKQEKTNQGQQEAQQQNNQQQQNDKQESQQQKQNKPGKEQGDKQQGDKKEAGAGQQQQSSPGNQQEQGKQEGKEPKPDEGQQGNQGKGDGTKPQPESQRSDAEKKESSGKSGKSTGDAMSPMREESPQGVMPGGTPSAGITASSIEEKSLGSLDEKFNTEFTGDETTISKNQSPADPRTKLKDTAANLQGAIQERAEQPMPLEYQEQLDQRR